MTAEPRCRASNYLGQCERPAAHDWHESRRGASFSTWPPGTTEPPRDAITADLERMARQTGDRTSPHWRAAGTTALRERVAALRLPEPHGVSAEDFGRGYNVAVDDALAVLDSQEPDR